MGHRLCRLEARRGNHNLILAARKDDIMTDWQKRLELLEGKKLEDPRLRGVRGSYRFDVENVGSWRAEVTDGAVTFTKSDADADCVIGSDADDLERILSG